MISRQDFLAGKIPKKISLKTHPVEQLLKSHKDKAMTVKDIQKELKMKSSTVRTRIGILRKRRKIIHKAPYFMWK